jgi:hypothetical protein
MRLFWIIAAFVVTGFLVFAAWPSYSKVRRATPFTDVGNYIQHISSLVEQERRESHKLPQSFGEARSLADRSSPDERALLERFEKKYGQDLVGFVAQEERFWVWSRRSMAAEHPPLARYAWYDSASGFRWAEALPQELRLANQPNQALLPTSTAVTPAASHPSRQP